MAGFDDDHRGSNLEVRDERVRDPPAEILLKDEPMAEGVHELRQPGEAGHPLLRDERQVHRRLGRHQVVGTDEEGRQLGRDDRVRR